MAVLMGAVGGGVQDYLGYVGFLREKNWGQRGKRATDLGNSVTNQPLSRAACAGCERRRFDATISFGSVLLITTCFMILGAAVLHPLRLVPTDADLYSQQSKFLGLIHPQLISVYRAGVFFAIFGAIYGMLPVYARTTYEISIAIWPKRNWNFDRLRLRVILYSAGAGCCSSGRALRRSYSPALWRLSPGFWGAGCGVWR